MRTRDTQKESIIKEQAIQLVVREGLDGFSMQKLAKAANVSPATLYIYYKDRDDLIVQISLEISTKLMEGSLRDFHPKMSFADGLRVQWKNRFDFFVKHPDEMEFIEQIRYTPLYKHVHEIMTKNFGEVMGKFVHSAINNGQLVPLPFEVYWSIAFAPLYQLIKFHTQGSSYKSAHFSMSDEIMEQTLELVLKALRP